MAEEAHSEGGLVFHPMDQFIVKPLFGEGPVEWYTPTNVTLWLGLAVLCTIALFVLMCLWPAAFAPLAYGFALLCAITTLTRLWSGYHTLR